MEGVAIHLVIGGVLFTAIGFIVAVIQNKKTEKNDK